MARLALPLRLAQCALGAARRPFFPLDPQRGRADPPGGIRGRVALLEHLSGYQLEIRFVARVA
mgnify:CR=1 FL=1